MFIFSNYVFLQVLLVIRSVKPQIGWTKIGTGLDSFGLKVCQHCSSSPTLSFFRFCWWQDQWSYLLLELRLALDWTASAWRSVNNVHLQRLYLQVLLVTRSVKLPIAWTKIGTGLDSFGLKVCQHCSSSATTSFFKIRLVIRFLNMHDRHFSPCIFIWTF